MHNASTHLDFPISLISNPFNSNSNYFASPHHDFKFLAYSYIFFLKILIFSPIILFEFKFEYLNYFIQTNKGTFLIF